MQGSWLVTGATGFVGGRLVQRLVAEGRPVVTVSRRPEVFTGKVGRVCDLEVESSVDALFEEVRPSVVFHLASLVTGSRDAAAVMPTFRANLASTVHVLKAALATGCQRVVMAGSVEELPLEVPARYPYAIAKRAATEYGEFFHHALGLPVVTLRLGLVYGPGLRRTNELIPHVVRTQLAGEAPRLTSGRRRLDWLFIDDAADAFRVAAEAPTAAGRVLDVGTGVLTSVADVARRLAVHTGGKAPEIGALPDRAQDVDMQLDAEATTRAIGWRAQVTLEEGLARTVQWYRDEQGAGQA